MKQAGKKVTIEKIMKTKIETEINIAWNEVKDENKDVVNDFDR